MCVCVPVHTRRPEESIQCPPLSLSVYPLEVGSLPEHKDLVFSARLEVSSLSNPLASATPMELGVLTGAEHPA